MGSHTSLTTRIKVEIQRGAAAKARLTHPECYLVRRGSTSDHHTIHAMRALHGSSHPKLAFSRVRAGAISAPAQPEVARAAANARHEPGWGAVCYPFWGSLLPFWYQCVSATYQLRISCVSVSTHFRVPDTSVSGCIRNVFYMYQ